MRGGKLRDYEKQLDKDLKSIEWYNNTLYVSIFLMVTTLLLVYING